MSEINANWGSVPPPPGVPGGHINHDDLAGFWSRFVAHLCDGLNTMVIILPFNFVAMAVGEKSGGGLVSYLGAAVSVYMLVRWTGERGGSPLRVRYGVIVVDANDGSFIGTRRAFFRWMMSLASQMVLLLGYLWVIWDPKKQTWHDKVANSVVVNRR